MPGNIWVKVRVSFTTVAVRSAILATAGLLVSFCDIILNLYVSLGLLFVIASPVFDKQTHIHTRRHHNALKLYRDKVINGKFYIRFRVTASCSIYRNSDCILI